MAQQQNEPSSPPLEILKLKWERQAQMPRNFDPSLIPTRGTFSDIEGRTPTVTPQTQIDAARTANSREVNPVGTVGAFPATPGRLPIFYVYSMKARNSGSKTIEGVAWDYVFVDTTTNTEVGRHQFLSFEKLASDKIVTFSSQLRSPPTRLLATTTEKKQAPQYFGKAIIQCVLYADDTTWRGSGAPTDICALLRTQRDLRKKKHPANSSS